MKYAKFISANALDYAPKTIDKDGIHYNPYPVYLMMEDGYKSVIETEMPKKTGYYYTASWTEETTQIVRVWTEHPNPDPEPSIEDRLDSIDAQAIYTATMTDTLLEIAHV